MATIPQTGADFPDFLPLRRFSSADYLQMIEAGVLGPRDRVELIGGVIIEMSPAGVPHNRYLIQILHVFAPLLGRFDIAIQGTLTVSEGHVYDPDFMLLQPRADRFKTKLPDASDVRLVIEAAETSFPRDQKIKMPVYASAGIPEYWIADLERETIVIHREPQAGGYRVCETHSGDDVVSPLAAPDFCFKVRQAFD